MRKLLPLLLLITPLAVPVLPAQEPAEEAAPSPRKKLPAFAVFKDGGELIDVMIPRYDAERNLLGVLRAQSLVLVDEWQLQANLVSIEFNHTEGALRGSRRGRIDLDLAFLNQETGMLTTTGPVEFRSKDLDVSGHGLLYSTITGQTYIVGPTTTRYREPEKIVMNTPHPLHAAALIGLSIMAAPAQNIEGGPALEVPAPQPSASAAAREDLADALSASAAASRKMAEFLETAAKANSQTIQAAPAGPVHEPDSAPLDHKPGPEEMHITSSNGIYLDADSSVLAYLGDVKVTHPQLKLSGANELKVTFGKKPANPEEATAEEPAPEEAEADEDGMENPFASFGDPISVMATGAVKIRVVPEEGDPIEASGAIFSYDIEKEQMVLSGGFPWIQRKGAEGTYTLYAQEAGLTLRIDVKSGLATTEGNWDTSVPLKRMNQR